MFRSPTFPVENVFNHTTQVNGFMYNHRGYRSFLAVQEKPRVVQLMSAPYKGDVVLNACPAHFGLDLSQGDVGVSKTHL